VGLLGLCAIATSSLFISGCVDDALIEPTSISSPLSAVGDAVSITNSGFESGETGWVFVDPFAISGDANSGSNSGKISGSGGIVSQSVSVNSNTNYTLSAYVKDAGTIGVTVGGSSTEESGDYSGWTQVSVNFNSGSNTSVTIYGEYNGDEGRFDDFELIEGTSSETGRFEEMVGKIVRIENVDSDLWLRITQNNTDDAAVELTTQASTGTWPRWEIEELSDGGDYYYRFRNVSSNRRLRPNGSGVTNMEVGGTGSTGTWTQWAISSDGNGNYVFKNRAFGTYINASDNSNTTIATTSTSESGDLTTWRIEDLNGNDANGQTTDSNVDYVSVPSRIEAEDYDDATEGRTESTSDSSGDLNVGWINTNEFLEYNVNVESSGNYTMDFRVASRSADIRFDIYQNNSLIGSISEGSTGGWQTWETVSTSVQLSSGNSTIRIVATGDNWNINWFEIKTGGTTVTPGILDPNKAPSENFDLSQWKLTISSGADIDIEDLNDAYTLNDQFYTGSDGGMVFKNYPAGPGTGTTSGATQYSRVELRELLGGEDSNESETQLNENNWVFSSSNSSSQSAAGGVDGVLTATLKVDRVTTAADGSDTKVGRIIIGQIHASDHEPIRLYYKLMPGTTKGAIYFLHEDSDTDEFAVNMIGDYAKTGANNAGDFSGASEPSNGIPLGEVFSYRIEVIGNMLYVDIIRDSGTVSADFDMSNSGYENDWMYFKAGLYSQNDQAESSSDYEQVTFYSVENTH